MKKLCTLTSLFYFVSLVVCFGQITVTFPGDRVVFQRNKSNNASITVAGYFTECVDKVEARFIPIKSNASKPELGIPVPSGGGWAVIQNSSTCGNFNGSISVSGGWYRLEVRGIRTGKDPLVGVVPHVGIGEVFLVAGQSNATGGDNNPTGPGASEDAVSSINFRNENNDTYTNLQLPCPEYVHLDQFTKTAPFGNYAWCWGAFGDKMVQKLNVPVMIFNTGWSATGIENWKQSIPTNGITKAWFGADYPAGLPFGHLRVALNNYIAQLGIRAVLWHQGETDTFVGTDQVTYRNDLRSIINESRALSGKPDLTWAVARASRYNFIAAGETVRASHTSEQIIAAQNDVIGIGTHGNDPAYKLNGVLAGPETDPYWDTSYRSDSVHFVGNGLLFLAQLWADHLNNDFFNNSNPYSAIPQPQINISQASSNTLTFSAATGWNAYHWLNEANCNFVVSNTQEWITGAGLFRLKTIDSFNNSTLSPLLYVSGTALPVTWKYFRGKASENGNASLEWATSDETNADFFEVERGTDPFNFYPVQKIEAFGNSKITREYNYQDYALQPATYYYRLKQTDNDGKYDFSRIISLHIKDKQSIKLFPNPVSDHLNIQSESLIYSVQLVNSMGIKMPIPPQQTNYLKLDMSKFPPGIYTVKVNEENFKILHSY